MLEKRVKTHWLVCRSSISISTPFSCRRAAVYFCEACLLFLALFSPGFFDTLSRNKDSPYDQKSNNQSTLATSTLQWLYPRHSWDSLTCPCWLDCPCRSWCTGCSSRFGRCRNWTSCWGRCWSAEASPTRPSFSVDTSSDFWCPAQIADFTLYYV